MKSHLVEYKTWFEPGGLAGLCPVLITIFQFAGVTIDLLSVFSFFELAKVSQS
jgi:hypothetical protein